MIIDKNSIIEIFNLAVENHKENKIEQAQNLYHKVLKLNPRHSETLNNLGVISLNLNEYQKANEYFRKAIKINPNHADAHYNLGSILGDEKEYQKAIPFYKKAIAINPNYTNAYYNLGLALKELGDFREAIDCFKKVIEILPDDIDAYNNYASLLGDTYDAKKAKEYLERAIKIDPTNTSLYWNLHGQSSNLDEALSILKKLYKIDDKHTRSKITISALEGYKGNFDYFNDILSSADSNHPYTRSIKWIFSLSKLPKIFFNRLNFFDAIISLTENSRPFYEFGVWKGYSFQYLMNTFKKGFGFDTFTGLPEVWHNNKEGTYSAFGKVSEIKGGEFIVGKFEDTLPKFFSKDRPLASLINFDADLYSSTLCALKYSNKIIDEKTILIFDEFIINKNWEKDEYKALNDFCDNLGVSYEVLAVSLYTKQVAVKLER